MPPKAEACAECTQNCLLMHKRDKNPSPVATTFFKVMFGDECSKVLFLPPRFAHGVQHMVGKETQLENSNGEKLKVKFTLVDGLLAFKEGWNKFWEVHGLKVGDFLVFHYIMESHFVVSMYGESGFPEIRHFGFAQPPMEETKRKNKVIVDDHIPSNKNTTNGHCSENKHAHTLQKETRIKKKRSDNITPPNVSTSNTHLAASSSQHGPSVSDEETSQRSEPLVKTTVCETPIVSLVDVEDEEPRRNSLDDFLTPKKASGERKNNVAVGGGGDETKVNESGKVLETRSQETAETTKETMPEKPKEMPENPKKLPEKPKKSPEKLKETTRNPIVTNPYSIKAVGGGGDETKVNESGKVLETRSQEMAEKTKETMPEKPKEMPEKPKEMPENPKKLPEKPKKLPEKPKESPEKLKETTRNPIVTNPYSIKKRLRNSMPPTTSSKIAKKDYVSATKHDTSGSRLQNVGGPSSAPGRLHKPIAKPVETPKKELPTSQGPIGGTKTGLPNPHKEENNNILLKVKPEPVDYDETPSDGTTNSSFSAVMSTYKYLELPKWVELRKVILLKNKDVFWPVLYQNKVGVKALTQNWEVFARERGIQPGDNCEFVLELESESNEKYTCPVFTVTVTSHMK